MGKRLWNLTHDDLVLNDFCCFRFVMIHISPFHMVIMGVPRRQSNRRSGLVTLPSVGAIP